MENLISRRSFISTTAALAAGACAFGSLSACSDSKVIIGSMPTEDILPFWVAESEGLFSKHNVETEIQLFDSAQSLTAALTSGDVQVAMTDVMRSVKLAVSGIDVRMEWISLGTEASQGAFGVLASPKVRFTSLREMTELDSSEGVGIAANTVPEYVFDMLCRQQGFDSSAIPKEEVPSLADRYSFLAEGRIVAAALPASLLYLGQANGMKIIAIDTEGENLSQSVIISRADKVNDNQLKNLRAAWDEAANNINKTPENYRSLLVEKANLNETIAETYPISTYPLSSLDNGTSAYPDPALITPQIEWMSYKGYTNTTVGYNGEDGKFSVG